MQNFNWWINRKDPSGKNVFAGGFLGLDNIGVFDRSAQLPTGGHLDQADGTAWMAFYCQNMLEIALILADYSIYEDIAFRFLKHFVWITYAMDRIGGHHDEMWDGKDGFFCDLLHFPNDHAVRLNVRSMVGLLPLCASTVLEPTGIVTKNPRVRELVATFKRRHSSQPLCSRRWAEAIRPLAEQGDLNSAHIRHLLMMDEDEANYGRATLGRRRRRR